MIAALALLLVLTVAAAEPTGTLTLACQGTKTDKDPNTSLYDKPQPISAGLVIDFTNAIIKGFPFNAEIKITEVTEVAVHFAAYEKIANNTHQIDGGIDRVTADVVRIR
jgi:hypothetical protein